MQIELPWPPKVLSPNARAHYLVKARSVKKYRWACFILARQLRPTFQNTGDSGGDIALTITFCPPDNQRRDRDNMIAAFKAGADGLAQAWGVNDSRFVPTYRVGNPARNGSVIVALETNRPGAGGAISAPEAAA